MFFVILDIKMKLNDCIHALMSKTMGDVSTCVHEKWHLAMQDGPGVVLADDDILGS
jgi:hypothetical protein